MRQYSVFGSSAIRASAGTLTKTFPCKQIKTIYRELQRAFEKELPVVPFRIENINPHKGL